MNSTTHSGAKASTNFASQLAEITTERSKPRSPNVHVIRSLKGSHLFLPNGSRMYPVTEAVADQFEGLLMKADQLAIDRELAHLGLDIPAFITDKPLSSPPLHAISLAISQSCNMGCTYCYAGQGSFGGAAKKMTMDTAFKAIDLLLENKANTAIQIAFMGGEPLVNRETLRKATVYALQKGESKNVNVSFSITTNGTLLTEDDAFFFEKYGFSVTISLDGLAEQHNKLRPMKGGGPSFDKIIKKVAPLLAIQRKMQVSARVTVSPDNSDLLQILEEFINMGFHSVGFSPLLNSNNGKDEMTKSDMDVMLRNMIQCGLAFEHHVLEGKRYPFMNMINALKELSKGTHRPYPCGAGAGYMGVSADEEIFACHRFVNEDKGKMGNLSTGVDPILQNTWLSERHVHQQDPCSQCWARYLCSGGCHHEVMEKGRLSCDYIRSWLHYTMQAHERLSRLKPGWYN